MARTRKTRRKNSEAPFTTILFSLLTLLLTATIWVALIQPAERKLERRLDLRDDLVRRVDARRREAHRLEVLQDALLDDPQTVERELRRLGMGRRGDHVLVDKDRRRTGR